MMVMEFRPGDEVTISAPEGRRSATFVGAMPHPLWPSLQLVIWRLGSGYWSHDALHPAQDVGEVTPSSNAERIERLRAALLDPGAIR